MFLAADLQLSPPWLIVQNMCKDIFAIVAQIVAQTGNLIDDVNNTLGSVKQL